MDNMSVASKAWELFSQRYSEGSIWDAIKLLEEDLSGDKSSEIAGFLTEASDSLYDLNFADNSINGTHVIEIVKQDDEWTPVFEDGLIPFIFDCAGIPVSEENLAMLNNIVEQ